jgi:hypothetical protein
MIEPSVGIILACLPTIRVLFPAIFSTLSKRSGDSNGTPAGMGPYQRHQAADEYPLTPVEKAGQGNRTTISGRPMETLDSDSNFSDLENAGAQTPREGPLNQNPPGSKIVVTREWKLSQDDPRDFRRGN